MTVKIFTFGVALLAAAALVGSAYGQSTAVLNSLEVQRLVKSGQPADNAALAAHFSALADRYAADAKRHEAMAKAFVGNPNRRSGAAMNAHCTQLAKLNTETAGTLRELAEHHRKLGAGQSSAPPRDAARFEGGAGAKEPSQTDLTELAAKATTRSDHLALQEYFTTLAKRYAATADEHVAIAAAYRGTKLAQAAAHCDRLIKLSRDSAKEATAAGEMHKQLADAAR